MFYIRMDKERKYGGIGVNSIQTFENILNTSDHPIMLNVNCN